MTILPLGDPVALTAALVDIPSVSGNEKAIADLVADVLTGLPHLHVDRDGDAIVARTARLRPRRTLLAGHLDTVPIADNVPSRRDGDLLYGCGTSDMKSGVAVMLHLAGALTSPRDDLTFVFYDHEEVAASKNGLGRLARTHPDWLHADLAILLEPTSAQIEAGCQGTLRVEISADGTRAHSARSWLGDNAIHHLAEPLATIAAYTPRSVDIDGCVYREGLSAVAISGGTAGNVIPDHATLTVNFRFAPDRSEEQAVEHVRALLGGPGRTLTLTDSAPGAPPALDNPSARAFVDALGTTPVAKYGWTDVARFASLGIPALNFGPGDPNLAHTRDEHVHIAHIDTCARALISYLR